MSAQCPLCKLSEDGTVNGCRCSYEEVQAALASSMKYAVPLQEAAKNLYDFECEFAHQHGINEDRWKLLDRLYAVGLADNRLAPLDAALAKNPAHLKVESVAVSEENVSEKSAANQTSPAVLSDSSSGGAA